MLGFSSPNDSWISKPNLVSVNCKGDVTIAAAAHLVSPLVFIIFFSAVFQAFGMYHIHSISALTEGGFLGRQL